MAFHSGPRPWRYELAVAGGGIFALQYGDYAGRRDALAITRTDKAGSFTGWLTIGEDGKVTLYTPHIDMGTGSDNVSAGPGADTIVVRGGNTQVKTGAGGDTIIVDPSFGTGTININRRFRGAAGNPPAEVLQVRKA